MSENLSDASNRLIDQATHTADEAMNRTQHLANQAMNGVSHSLQTARKQVVKGANQATDKTVAYIRNEPVKSVLIAAAAGAALVALTRFIGRPNSSL
jgi:ElaB/YqjD/DUF883 family membrane-anchored ribosome-binding protein